MDQKSYAIEPARARAIWLQAQRLVERAPFGAGPQATEQAIAHLGYVQIDTINVIERCHHHILYTRIPDYARDDLSRAQSVAKSVFEYWTHALAYVPVTDYRFFMPAMRRHRARPGSFMGPVDARDYRAVLRRIRDEGALSIRDITDDVLVDKIHPWASRKPSKRALNHGFLAGDLTISARAGMVKTYELTRRHFGWERPPKAASAAEIADYLLERALRAQAIVSLESICFGLRAIKPAIARRVAAAVRRKHLVPVHLAGHERVPHWARPAAIETPAAAPALLHLLSPFDPLTIQRPRLHLFFGYDHRFEAYVPAARRKLGYFALPVLAGDEIVAALDLKADRHAGALRVKKWTWIARPRAGLKATIEDELARFERFQLAAAQDAGEPVAD